MESVGLSCCIVYLAVLVSGDCVDIRVVSGE